MGLQRPVQHGSCCLPHLPASSSPLSMLKHLTKPINNVPIQAYSIAGSNGGSIVHPPINNSEAEISSMHDYHFVRLFRAGKQASQTPMSEEAATPNGGTPHSTVQGWSEPCPASLAGLCQFIQQFNSIQFIQCNSMQFNSIQFIQCNSAI